MSFYFFLYYYFFVITFFSHRFCVGTNKGISSKRHVHIETSFLFFAKYIHFFEDNSLPNKSFAKNWSVAKSVFVVVPIDSENQKAARVEEASLPLRSQEWKADKNELH